MYNILFLCTGNTCRSSMAEGMFKNLIKKHNMEDKFSISSAGTAVSMLLPASDNAISALLDFHLDLTNHMSRLATREILEETDLVLAMTEAHKNHVLKLMPEAEGKVFTLVEYATDGEQGDIADPYLMNLETYRNCRDEIGKYLEMIIPKIKAIGK